MVVGWDLVINVTLPETNQHVLEVQIHLKPLQDIRKKMGGHVVYTYYRLVVKDNSHLRSLLTKSALATTIPRVCTQLLG